MTRVEQSEFRGRKAFLLSSDAAEAVFFTEFGAKLVSLRSKRNGHEFLTQGREDTHPTPLFDTPYVDNDLCGADDMFPSINECCYPTYPWQGVRCPDHGELWSIPWRVSAAASSVDFETFGVRLPYRFQRRATFTSDAVLRLDYSISNLAPFELHAIWAFHPLFEAERDAQIVLPRGVTSVQNTLDFNNRLGAVGTIHSWSRTTDKRGDAYDLSRFQTDSGVCEKFWAVESLEEGAVQLLQEPAAHSVTVRFPVDQVPYIGIWKNQGGLLGQNNVSIEPATGALDDLAVSSAFGRSGTISPRDTVEFWLEIELG